MNVNKALRNPTTKSIPQHRAPTTATIPTRLRHTARTITTPNHQQHREPKINVESDHHDSTTDGQHSQENGTPTHPKENIDPSPQAGPQVVPGRGHVFITQGYVSELACDAFWVSSDFDLKISKSWLEVLGEKFVANIPAPPPKWTTGEQRVLALPPYVNSQHPKSWRARQWTFLVNFGGLETSIQDPLDPIDELLELYERVILEFVEAVVSNVGTQGPSLFGRPTKLIGIPLAGTSNTSSSVLKNHVGRIIQKTLPLLRESAAKYNLDFMVGTGSGKPKYAAVQSARARGNDLTEFSSVLSPELMQHGKRLAALAARGDLALFIGAGVSVGCGLPLWKDLLHNLAQDANMTPKEVAEVDTMNALDAAKIIEGRYQSREVMLQQLADQLRSEHYALTHSLLSCLPCRDVITTNYDTSFERASLDTTIKRLAVIPYYPRHDCERWLLKMHGCVTSPSDIVLTREDYIRYSEKHQALAGIVQSLLITKHMLFIGFSLVDDNFHKIMDAVRRTHSSRHDLNDPQVRATVARAYAGSSDKHEKLAEALKFSDEMEKSGTILSLYPHPLMDAYWRQLFEVINMTDTEHSNESKSHVISDSVRVLEIFLDYIAFEASKLTMVDNLLLPNFENTLNIEERMARYAILNLVENFPKESLGTIAWEKICSLVVSMGGSNVFADKAAHPGTRLALDDGVDENEAKVVAGSGSDLMSSAVLKYDHFPGIHTLPTSLVLPGIPNFRKIPGYPVYGSGQPTFEALSKILGHLRDTYGVDHLLWIQLRQEPVIYINGQSFSPRRRQLLNETLGFLNASRAHLAALQEDLVQAVRSRAMSNSNTVTFFRDSFGEHPSDRQNEECSMRVLSPTSVTTAAGLSDMCRAMGFDIQCERIPIADEKAPAVRDFDGMVQVMVGQPASSSYLLNCKMGKGRTTCGTVVACLVHQALGRPVTGEIRPDHESYDHPLANGEFECVKSLLELHPQLPEAKTVLDDVIDLCGPPTGLQNLRESVIATKANYDGAQPDKKLYWQKLARNAIRRYVTLICFSLYVLLEGSTQFNKAFGEWLSENEKMRILCQSDFADFVWA